MKKHFWALLMALLMLCTGASAEVHYVTASPTPVPWVHIEGKVSDASNPGTALSGVSVKCGTISATTDAQGRYAMDVPPDAAFEVHFSKTNFDAAVKTVNATSGQTVVCDCALTPSLAHIAGTVSDATNPSLKLAGVTVKCGSVTATTDANGRYTMNVVGTASLQLHFSKSGYIAATETVSAQAGQSVTRDCSLSPELASNEYRVVLTWNATPADLDSHLVGAYNGRSYHIYYPTENRGSASLHALLDCDDTNGNGPETTTFTIEPNTKYEYAVHNFTDRGIEHSTTLSSSGAKVVVYAGNTLVQTFTVPNGVGTVWHVFSLRNGVITPDGTINDTKPDI